MKSDYINILLTLAIGLLAACSSNDDELTRADEDKPVPLEIVAGIDAQAEGVTRAVETAWEAGDDIGVTVTVHNSSTPFPDKERGENLPYTFNDGTNYETYGNTYRLFSPKSTKIYLSSTKVDIYGYYPYKESVSLVATDPMYFIPIDVSIQNPQKAIDFMRASKGNISNDNTSIELLFQHRLVKLVFNLRQGDGLLEDELKDATSLTMKIGGQPTVATYNIFSDAFVITAGKLDIVPVKAPSAPTGYVRTFEAIVLPNGANNPAEDRTVTVKFYRNPDDEITNTFIIPASTYFNKGYKYTYNVTVNATSIVVDDEIYTEQL